MELSSDQATYNAVQFFDATTSLVYSGHGDETESTRAARLTKRHASMTMDRGEV